MTTSPPPPVSSFRLLLVTVISVVGSLLLGAGIMAGLWMAFDLDPTALNLTNVATPARRNSLRLILLVNTLFTFAVPAVVALWFCYGDRWAGAAGLTNRGRRPLIVLSAIILLIAVPMIGLSAYLNLQLDLPDWVMQSEDVSNATLEAVLTMNRADELLLSLLAVGISAGFCEELMFRGLLQGRLLRPVVGEHAAIWIVAVVFSLIHFEFAGFLPRMLLGALLGYTYRWSGTLWVPVVLHMLFNGVQVLSTYTSGEFTPDTSFDADSVPVILISGVVSTLIVTVLSVKAERLRAEADGEVTKVVE